MPIGSMSFVRLIGLFLAPLAIAAGVAEAECYDGWICIDEIDNGVTVDLRARSLRNFPITFTLDVSTRDFRISGSDTVTRTLEPHQSLSVMTLNRAADDSNASYRHKLRWAVGRRDVNHDDDYLYTLPYAKNRTYRVLQGYGSRFSHTGREEFSIDFKMPEGTAVHAARSGVVARIEESNSKGCWKNGCGQYANFIVVLHDDGSTGEYYHLQKNGALVDAGDKVVVGQKIGLSGNTGHTTMPHLHFGVYRAISRGRTQSISVRFQSADGIIDKPRSGARYQAL